MTRVSMANRGGRLLAAQHMEGSGAVYFTLPSANPQIPASGTTNWLRLSFTPPVDCYWDVSANLGLFSKTDAAYHYGYAYTQLTPADADGDGGTWVIEQQHAQVDNFWVHFCRRCFRLLAGTAYVCDVYASVSGGSWQVYQAPGYMHIDGLALTMPPAYA